MMESKEAAGVLEEIARQTQSEIILLFIVIVVGLIVAFIPIYRMILRDRKERREHDKEREKQLMAVITANTEVNAVLRTTLEAISVTTNTSFIRVHERMDAQTKELVGHGMTKIKMQASLEEVLRKQLIMSEDLKRGFEELRRINEQGGE